MVDLDIKADLIFIQSFYNDVDVDWSNAVIANYSRGVEYYSRFAGWRPIERYLRSKWIVRNDPFPQR